jgi:hypothetical protein
MDLYGWDSMLDFDGFILPFYFSREVFLKLEIEECLFMFLEYAINVINIDFKNMTKNIIVNI